MTAYLDDRDLPPWPDAAAPDVLSPPRPPAEYVDVAAVLNGTLTAPETACGGVRADGVHLCYLGAVNVLLGAPEAGKTLAAGAMAADELNSGGSVLWIDLDHNGPAAILDRLRRFGVPATTLTDPSRFRLATPDDTDAIAAIVHDCANWHPTFIVLDSIGELMPMYGANSNDADDYTRVHRTVLTALARTGAGVLTIDHEAKGVDSRNYGATGSAAKKRTIDGALLRVTNVDPFTKEHGGRAQLSIVKDRHGALRALAAGREPVIASFVVTPVPGGSDYRFETPTPTMQPTSDLEILAALVPPPSSKRDVQDRLHWGGTRAGTALRLLRQRDNGPDGPPGPGPVPVQRSTSGPTGPHPYRGDQDHDQDHPTKTHHPQDDKRTTP
ncbi:AAA family ATPase [Microbacterium sp. ASV81]|uniref:AAA family ATPase n=1 Tax=Microbacterium capsulatum TaxID=3041921 RepID=A0ABU0XF77_9MICO|nr:AAA family ATPase [Microbacterium sp. ASV81]MDQ4213776.1 AAA family ATPase [Microbacterium sp. ASV81]